MLTIKIPYKLNNPSDLDILSFFQKEYSSILRVVYNRKKDGFSDKDIRSYIKSLNNLNKANCWVTESALYQTKTLIKNNNDNKVIFGSKKQFIRRCKNLISNKEYKELRLSNIYSVGQANEKGNRFFSLDILEKNQIIFKPNRDTKVILNLPNLKPNIKKELSLIEIKSKNKEIPFTVSLNKTHIFISYEEFKDESLNYYSNKERFLSMDLNPNHIGLSINEYAKETKEYKIIKTIDYDLSELIKNSDANKIKYETLELCKTIMNIAMHHRCKYIFMEDLNMRTGNYGKGKGLNKLINNQWFRNLIVNNITKRCNIIGIKVYLINPAYSSYIGNLQYEYSDPINASLEIGRRGYEIFILKNKDNFYPSYRLKESILHQWKEKGIEGIYNWKELFLHIKNSKLRYRVSLENYLNNNSDVLRQEYKRPAGLLAYIC